MMPQLMTEIMTNSQNWDNSSVHDCMNEVFDEHPDLKQAMEEAGKSRKVPIARR